VSPGAFRLDHLLAGVPGAEIRGGAASATVGEVRDDSRAVLPGDLFVAVPGAAADGRTFVADAAARGAAAVLADAWVDFPGLVIKVPSVRQALGIIAAHRYDAVREMDLVAITGTNGKTTTSYLVESILAAARHDSGRVGVVGTISYRFAGRQQPAPLTTPGALALHALFAQMRGAGVTDVVLEASSHALDQGRLEGCRFRVAALTNVTQDHLDYHGTMARYFDAKAILFERLLRPTDGVAVFLTDRDDGRRMRDRVKAALPAGARCLGVATRPGPGQGGDADADADVAVRRFDMKADGLRADFATPAGPLEVTSRLVGDYNLANVALAVGIAIAHGIGPDAIARGVAALPGVPGRLERVPSARDVLCVVDYAHTPDALERAMAALRPLCAGRLIVVFGCGGDRDRSKRPLMGRSVARDADIAIVTSDNPRTEPPASIVDMIVEGVRNESIPELALQDLASAARGYHVAVDRRTALRRAAAAAKEGDVLLIAGKGHEDYQIIGTTKTHFDDREEATAALREGQHHREDRGRR